MRRSLKLLLAAVAVLAVLCSGAWAAGPTKVTESTITWEASNSPYYVEASKTIHITDRITVNGKVELILRDGCTLSADKGISVIGGSSLTITTPDAPNGTGKLLAYAASPNTTAAIGGDFVHQCGEITIKGGIITATSDAGYCAAIGGGGFIDPVTLKDDYAITIAGGTVTASSTGGGAGIGSGGAATSMAPDGILGGTITITGGTVNAASARYGAGIGGGKNAQGGTITIAGGTVTATSELNGAGIGSGEGGGAGGTITIAGGTVTAMSKSRGAGIGGGKSASGGDIKITGGTVTATAIYSGAGIGGGSGRSGGNINISGGTVTVTADTGSGIGGGDYATDQGKLSSDPNGSALITASSVGAAIDGFDGVIFDESAGGSGKVYGDATVSGDVVISADKTLEVQAGATLTVDPGASLTNKGTISGGGKLVNDGVVENTGTISTTVDNNGAYFHDGGGEVAGDYTLSDGRTITGTLTVKDGASFTVGSGAKLTVEDGATIDNKGTLVNDGNVKLPANTDISGLGMTGSGTVEMDGKTYDNTGKDTTPSPTPTPDPDPTPTPDQTHDPEQGKHTSAIIADETDSLWNAHAGQDLTIHIDVDLAKFDNSVSLDGVPLTQDTASVSHDFGAREGSTIVTIWEKTLKEHIKTDGEHTAEVGFKDGTAIHTFTVRGTGEAGETKHSSGGACTAGAAAIVGLAALAAIKRSKK